MTKPHPLCHSGPDRLVIFDCDGVLVNSEPITMAVLSDMLSELGLELSATDALNRFKGRKIADCLIELGDEFGVNLDAAFVARFRARCVERYQTDLTAPSHLEQALDTLSEPFCVASNAPREKIEVTLSCVDLLPRFNGQIYSAYELKTWKPDPKLFLTAATKIGVPPERAIVIEDSEVGLQAAWAAGMSAIYFTPQGQDNAPPDQAITMRCFSELPGILTQWRNGLVPNFHPEMTA